MSSADDAVVGWPARPGAGSEHGTPDPPLPEGASPVANATGPIQAEPDDPGGVAPGNDAPGNDTPGNDTPGNDTPGNDVSPPPPQPPPPSPTPESQPLPLVEPGEMDSGQIERVRFEGLEPSRGGLGGADPSHPSHPSGPWDGVEDLTSSAAERDGDLPRPSERSSSPPPPPPPFGSGSGFARPLPRTIAIANQKGGVGKTTTAVNLGAGLAELGYRVVIVDLDPQGNATTGVGINARNLQASIYDVIMNGAALEDCVEPTTVRNLFVAPATIDLAGAEIELVPAFSRELRLRRALDALDGDFDFTLIDCPPSLGLLTINGLAAAQEVVVPIQCEYYALEGLGQLLRNVSLVQTNLNPRLEVTAIVLTMYDARTKLAEQVAQEVRAHFGAKVCRNVVPRTVRLSEAPSFGQPIIVFDPSSRGAIAYRELAKEVSGGAAIRSG